LDTRRQPHTKRGDHAGILARSSAADFCRFSGDFAKRIDLEAFAARRNWNREFRITTVVSMRIFLLRPATHLHLNLDVAASRYSLRG
jgi:hypothetical protein